MKIREGPFLWSPDSFTVIIECIYCAFRGWFQDQKHAFDFLCFCIIITVRNDFLLWDVTGFSNVRSSFIYEVPATLLYSFLIVLSCWTLGKNKTKLMSVLFHVNLLLVFLVCDYNMRELTRATKSLSFNVYPLLPDEVLYKKNKLQQYSVSI